MKAGYLFGKANGVKEAAKKGVHLPPRNTMSFSEVSFAEDEGVDISQILNQLRDVIPMTKAEWLRVGQEMEQKAFFAAGMTKQQIENDLLNLLTNAVEGGHDFEWFRDQIKESMMKYTAPLGISVPGQKVKPWHAEMIFRTNTATIMQAGKNALFEHPVMEEEFPAAEVVEVDDGRTRKTHLQINGRKWLIDNPIWEKLGGKKKGPPWDYNCRGDKIFIHKDDWDGVESSTKIPKGFMAFGVEVK